MNRSTRRPRRRSHHAACVLAAGLLGLAMMAGLVQPSQAAERLIVWARTGVTEQDLGKGLGPYRMSRQHLGRQGWHVLTLPSSLRAQDMHQRLRLNPLFQHVEPDRLHPLSQVYNDTFYSSLWHLERLSATPAWVAAGGMGHGVTVAVVDTGVQAEHPDLAGAVVGGWNVVEGTSNAADTHGHGTSVAGLVVARINNGMGVAGLAAGARVMPIRVSQPNGSARTSDIAMGIQWAADRGVRIVNVSFEGVMDSMTIRSAAASLFRQGGLLIAAAGNRGLLETHTGQPGLMVVGAVDQSDQRPAWATHGEHLALAAPGDGLWTTGLGGGYRVVWGTSFASPLVAATAALMWEVAPDATAAQVEQWLRESAVDLGVQGPDAQYGHGRLQAAAAVAAARRWQSTRSVGTPSTPPNVNSGAAAMIGVSGSTIGPLPTPGAATATPLPVGMTNPPGTASGAWLALDVDAAALDDIARVHLSMAGQLLMTDAEPPFAFSVNLLDQPRGLLKLRLTGLNAQGLAVAQTDLEVSNQRSSLIVSGIRLNVMPRATTPETIAGHVHPKAPETRRPGTGWAEPRWPEAARRRQ